MIEELLGYYLLNHLWNLICFFNSSNIFSPNSIPVVPLFLLSPVMNGREINEAQHVSFNHEEVLQFVISLEKLRSDYNVWH